jgi:glyoxylase-like metal-dependent hydrolase (beta-lactamase superfamily II)
MIVHCLVVGPFMENSYVLECEQTKECIFVDPGDEAERFIELVEKRKLIPKGIVNTHAHIDHIGAVEELKRKYKIEFRLHEEDKEWLEQASLQARMFGLGSVNKPTADSFIKDGEEISFGKQKGKVIHTPGHSAGGICLHFGDVLISGDTLFAASIGRTDLPGGNLRQLLRSIKERLFPLGDHVKVYSGHGPETTIGEERRHNPFLDGGFDEA